MGSNDSEISFSILAIKNIWIFRIKCPSIKYIYIHTHIHICIYISFTKHYPKETKQNWYCSTHSRDVQTHSCTSALAKSSSCMTMTRSACTSSSSFSVSSNCNK